MGRFRHPERVDGNQELVVKWLRKFGASVLHLHELGKGAPDLLVGFGGKNFLLELKDDNKPKSKRKLTSDEKKWHARWHGGVCVVENPLEAAHAVGIYPCQSDKASSTPAPVAEAAGSPR